MTFEESISMNSSNNTSDEELKEVLKKRLELELGLPLTPKSAKKIEKHFDDDYILVDNFPLQGVSLLKIGGHTLFDEDYCINESEGIIYLNKHYSGLLYLEYSYGLDDSEFEPLLDLMVEYETDTSWNKNATTIHENNVSVSYDSSLGKGARIQSMIDDLKSKYSVVVEMI